MIIRCISAQQKGQWVAASLEFGLAAQADTLAMANAKLQAQIDDYIDEALHQDKAHKKQLLTRKAPWSWYLFYYYAQLTAFLFKVDTSSFFVDKPTLNTPH